jgi:hypothetical protein
MGFSGQMEFSSTDFSLWGSEKTWQECELEAVFGNANLPIGGFSAEKNANREIGVPRNEAGEL